MTDHHAEHRMRAAAQGLTYVSDNSCPRHLTGRPHLELECWCASRLNDHGRAYRSQDGTPVVAWEPYDVHMAELRTILAAAETDGLAVTLTGCSPWNPGRTLAVLFVQKSQPRAEASNRKDNNP